MQYDALPGDHRNAYDYFDGSGGSAVCGTNADTNTTVGAGCNGDGNNEIYGFYYEQMRSWQHLTLAKLLLGSYTGTFDGAKRISPNVNAPASEITGGGYSLITYDYFNLATYRPICHTIILGSTIESIYNNYALLSPPDAQTIDKKWTMEKQTVEM